VTLVFSQWFDRITDAIESERKLKKWSRAKKEAFIRGDIALLQQLAKRKSSLSGRALILRSRALARRLEG
jgi:putative endonuclease